MAPLSLLHLIGDAYSQNDLSGRPGSRIARRLWSSRWAIELAGWRCTAPAPRLSALHP